MDDLDPQLVRQLDAVMDAGPLKGGSGSTVVDVTQDIPRILREGEISEKEILSPYSKINIAILLTTFLILPI